MHIQQLVMRSLWRQQMLQFFMPSSTLRLIVVVNTLAAFHTGHGASVLVALLTFGAGMVGDLVIWRRLPSDGFGVGGCLPA